jgi:hypothetical protein
MECPVRSICSVLLLQELEAAILGSCQAAANEVPLAGFLTKNPSERAGDCVVVVQWWEQKQGGVI